MWVFQSASFLPVIVIILIAVIKQVNEYERGVMFTLGKFTGVKGPGWRLVIPVFQSMRKVDIRTKAVDVPDQEAITKDNIPIRINAVIYYRVSDTQKAILEVENFFWAMSQMAQTTMRNAVGETTLDNLLQNRDDISKSISRVIDIASDPWGIKVESVELKDIVIPEDLKRTISKEAEAEREKRAVIIKADGDRIAATNLAAAATILDKAPGAMHLRTLQTINDLSSDQSNTTVWMVPMELLEAIKGVADKLKK
ncbi:slipin family protein [Candidatus Gracilibacteria bacterium]|nr:slipin family protein [Candidatus Gracilibacteria bacterium]